MIVCIITTFYLLIFVFSPFTISSRRVLHSVMLSISSTGITVCPMLHQIDVFLSEKIDSEDVFMKKVQDFNRPGWNVTVLAQNMQVELIPLNDVYVLPSLNQVILSDSCELDAHIKVIETEFESLIMYQIRVGVNPERRTDKTGHIESGRFANLTKFGSFFENIQFRLTVPKLVDHFCHDLLIWLIKKIKKDQRSD